MNHTKANSGFAVEILPLKAETFVTRERDISREVSLREALGLDLPNHPWDFDGADQPLMQSPEKGASVMEDVPAHGNENPIDKRVATMGAVIPRRRDTIVAGVLARLFEDGSPLTAWDGVDEFRTLHLDGAIRTLKKEYGWPVESISCPTYKRNGTIAYVTGYKLPQTAIDYAFGTLDAKVWIQLVKSAQAIKRMRDGEKAAALDFYRLTTNHPSFRTIGQYLYQS